MKEIPVKQRDGTFMYALVDDEDYALVSAYKWWNMAGYANGYLPLEGKRRKGINRDRPPIAMHRLVMNAAPGTHIDHTNHNRLDNQKGNLRFCTESQNRANKVKYLASSSSKYKGVTKVIQKKAVKWIAQSKVNGRHAYIGIFHEECDAAQAYNFFVEEHFGEFAVYNTPLS